MSKIIRRLHRQPRSLLSHRPGESYWPITRRETVHMEAKHRRWPLGTPVLAVTPIGLLHGKVVKHWRSTEYPHGCSVEFREPVNLGNGNGGRYAHVIPFRHLVRGARA